MVLVFVAAVVVLSVLAVSVALSRGANAMSRAEAEPVRMVR